MFLRTYACIEALRVVRPTLSKILLFLSSLVSYTISRVPPKEHFAEQGGQQTENGHNKLLVLVQYVSSKAAAVEEAYRSVV